MSKIQKFLAFFGRIFISAIFLYSATMKIMDWQASETLITNLICDWHASVSSPLLEKILETLLPYNTFILILSIALEILGGLLVFFGFYVRSGALLLLGYMIPVTLLTYQFWNTDPVDANQMMHDFLKNLSLVGALFTLLAFGAGDEGKDEGEFMNEKGNNPFNKGL